MGEDEKGERGREARPPAPPCLKRKTPPDFIRGGGRAGSADSVYCQRRSLHPRPKLPPAAPRQTQTEVGVKPAIEHWHTFTGAGFLRSVQIYMLTSLAVLPACRHEGTADGAFAEEKRIPAKGRGPFFKTPAPIPPRRHTQKYQVNQRPPARSQSARSTPFQVQPPPTHPTQPTRVPTRPPSRMPP